MFKKWRDNNGSFWPFRLCGNMQGTGLLKEARGKRCHTTVSKLQRKGFLVLKRYKDAKNHAGQRGSEIRPRTMSSVFMGACGPVDWETGHE